MSGLSQRISSLASHLGQDGQPGQDQYKRSCQIICWKRQVRHFSIFPLTVFSGPNLLKPQLPQAIATLFFRVVHEIITEESRKTIPVQEAWEFGLFQKLLLLLVAQCIASILDAFNPQEPSHCFPCRKIMWDIPQTKWTHIEHISDASLE